MSVLSFRLYISAILLCASSIVCSAPTGLLNDTGIAFCSDDFTNTANCAVVAADSGTHPRQDGKFVTIFSFTKVANNGNSLSASASLGGNSTDWACTKDNTTGLTWEIKTSNGLRSQDHTYTWFNSDPNTNGGDVGIASGGNCFTTGRCDTEKYVEDVNATGLCGGSDWRMPTYQELQSIVDYGRNDPSINPTYFPNTPVAIFWSGSPYAGNSSSAWNVYFSYGHVDYGGYRGSAKNVRLVRP